MFLIELAFSPNFFFGFCFDLGIKLVAEKSVQAAFNIESKTDLLSVDILNDTNDSFFNLF